MDCWSPLLYSVWLHVKKLLDCFTALEEPPPSDLRLVPVDHYPFCPNHLLLRSVEWPKNNSTPDLVRCFHFVQKRRFTAVYLYRHPPYHVLVFFGFGKTRGCFDFLDVAVQDTEKSRMSLMCEVLTIETFTVLANYSEQLRQPHSKDKHDFGLDNTQFCSYSFYIPMIWFQPGDFWKIF